MPRKTRLVVPDFPLHIIQRGNNRQQCFSSPKDFHVYLELLHVGATRNGCLVHAYVLMTNHVHILVTPAETDSPSAMMKSVGEQYVRYFNQCHQRTGTLWDGRYRSCLVQDDTYLLVCHRYIELNPVRAGIVIHPSLYRWSSHRRNAYNQPDKLITPHSVFMGLDDDEGRRANTYRDLFQHEINPEQLRSLRDATNSGKKWSDPCIKEIAK